MSSNILTVGTYNVAGIRKNYTKIHFLYEAFKSIDIFALQETHFRDDADASLFTQIFSAQFKLYISNCHNETHAGIVLGINHHSRLQPARKIFEIDGRAIGVLFTIESKKFYVICVYVPASQQNRGFFFEELFQNVSEHFCYFDECILLGDFNFTENPSLDRSTNSIYEREIGSQSFLRIKNHLNLVDFFRHNFPSKQIFTFFSRSAGSESRIDRIYTSLNISDSISSFEVKDFAITLLKKIGWFNLKLSSVYGCPNIIR